ncbi:phage integrase N-terminal SAM-like domain-containing protein, partial [Roseiflexus sp.]|uniref:phage integrase N-terminal SAM-like domain-containing protein n=1 Tax=Roseiflexus sp. TaxID=2562120 RepID=UPI00398A9649
MARKLLDQVRDILRAKHYSYRTEEAYIDWIRRFILFHNKRHPAEMGTPEIQAFLTYLATERNVSASTQNQALAALLFLYREVLHKDIDFFLLPTAKRPERLPTVLTREEVQRLLGHLTGVYNMKSWSAEQATGTPNRCARLARTPPTCR